VPFGAPLIALTATVTKPMRLDICKKLEMMDSKLIYAPPNRPNIYYEVVGRNDIEQDMSLLAAQLKATKVAMPRIVIYCRSLNLCSDLYGFFLAFLGDDSYYPPGATHISDNRLFGMYHAHTIPHNKKVVMDSMLRVDGVVRLVFATVALGMGVNLVGVNRIIHYGAPSSVEDYFQESGRAGRTGDAAKSTIYWKPSDAPRKENLLNPRNAELAAVRQFLENSKDCRRQQLLNYFDSTITIPENRDYLLCCDVCASKIMISNCN
jgi:superfamily II DNA helicase RecQ